MACFCRSARASRLLLLREPGTRLPGAPSFVSRRDRPRDRLVARQPIARRIGKDTSTVSRELQRNGDDETPHDRFLYFRIHRLWTEEELDAYLATQPAEDRETKHVGKWTDAQDTPKSARGRRRRNAAGSGNSDRIPFRKILPVLGEDSGSTEGPKRGLTRIRARATGRDARDVEAACDPSPPRSGP